MRDRPVGGEQVGVIALRRNDRPGGDRARMTTWSTKPIPVTKFFCRGGNGADIECLTAAQDTNMVGLNDLTILLLRCD